ncbi:MAG: DUF58 domain-containing protein [Gemmatimonadales bacterium]|nr:MAG: DUF58 domain-containing protein [Gemmatimonadales bacterium]
MNPGGPSVLSARVVASLGDLELAARLVVEGMRSGGHRSLQRGFGTEFLKHRPYRPGDSLRYLDWKLLARTDRLYTRQFRETTNLTLLLVVDTSASMGFPQPDAEEGGPTRLRYAAVLAASLAWLASSRGDAVGLLARLGGEVIHVPPRSGQTHLRRVIASLDGLVAEGNWAPVQAIEDAASRLKRRGIVVVLSDFYDDEESVRGSLRRVARRGHDVSMIQLTSDPEMEFRFRGELEFEDAESGRRVVTSAAVAGELVRSRIRSFHESLREGALRDGIDHVCISTSEPPGPALRRHLLARGR